MAGGMMLDVKQSIAALPIARQLMLCLIVNVLFCLILVALMSMYTTTITSKLADSRHIKNYGALIESIANQTSSQADLSEAISSLALSDDVGAVCLYRSAEGGQKVLLAGFDNKVGKLTCQPHFSMDDNFYSREITWSPLKRGEVLQLYIKPHTVLTLGATGIIGWVVAIFLFYLPVAYWFANMVGQRFLAPLQLLSNVIKQITETRDFSVRADIEKNSVVGELPEYCNAMLASVESNNQDLLKAKEELELRVREVDVSNRELTLAMQKLRSTQKQLINNEKMASLGGLVAGVAHEINTPVGVGVTAASTLVESTRTASEKYRRGELTNSELLRYMKHATSASGIILDNLDRAANLIKSFKQVAVDQSTSEIRVLDVKEYIGQVLLSLHPQLSKTKVSCEFSCPDNIEIRSYPGAISQIVTNLVMNALVHAYDDGKAGCLSLKIYESDADWISMVFSDDGCGISPENLARVWDPFFTTNRNGGGSGLGLHIVYNLVTQQLCGSVDIKSRVLEGTTISFLLPKDVGKVAPYEKN
ncbi:Sensor protein ZraS [Zhongshania aliphaticivorans]|uniref:histidine kinase n=2 Tax=Zhongshania aliphaticivorans TaxID=1470434 RepID=A0A5S9NCR6_9GAMM|nr:HAMP domain-containing sensor histidine kinase [Zhongshania aliphaticivorans]CAA0087164.1 Sensor protein ZraS [Zhongshania aliphaticivorans]CAA0114177.1 Sensor protein ZraS [Zhongshania aliphaticivorans]